MKYKITKIENKYYIRNTTTGMLLNKEFVDYEDARAALSIRPDVNALCYELDKQMFAKLKPLYEITQETNWGIDTTKYSM